MKESLIAEVVVPLPLNKSLDYLIPPEFYPMIAVGMRVLVPLEKRKVTGYIIGLKDFSSIENLKSIEKVLDPYPLFGPMDLSFFKWIANYYFSSLGEVIKCALPAGINIHSPKSRLVKPRLEKVVRINEDRLRQLSFSELKQLFQKTPRQFEILKLLRKQGEMRQKQILSFTHTAPGVLRSLESKGLIQSFRKEVYRTPDSGEYRENYFPLQLTPEQNQAIKKIISKLKEKRYAPFLLHGVTGSGKTEVYLSAIQAALEVGRTALVLVPEIALTPQLISRFKSRFGIKIAQLHSRLSAGERFDEWRRILKGEASIVIGARSAIFAPLKSLGVIVVDEEHDPAYKQEERIRYNARDLALVKAKIHQAVVILGSATPAIETFYNTRIRKINYLHLSRRIDNRPLPQVEVIDMRREYPGTILSRRLKEAIQERWQRGEQTILFLNRRGFSPMVICRKCGFVPRCPNCNISLVFHQNEQLLLCHYCNFAQPTFPRCCKCHSDKIGSLGFGTERLEKEVGQLFRDLKVGRLDRDTTAKKHALSRILNQFHQGKTELLIGTQMITKGHDIPRVTLVGVINADQSLNFPDFRAGERTFQLLTQVAGRAGRGEVPGTVIIQTYNPEHPSIQMAINQDFSAFYKKEISPRQELGFPPFARLVNFRIIGPDISRTKEKAHQLGVLSRTLQEKENPFQKHIEILGPAEAPREKLKGKYRFQMLVKSPDYRILHSFTEKILTEVIPQVKPAGVKISVDVDPIDLL